MDEVLNEVYEAILKFVDEMDDATQIKSVAKCGNHLTIVMINGTPYSLKVKEIKDYLEPYSMLP